MNQIIFTMQCYAIVVYAVIIMSVHLSKVGVLLKWLNIGSCKQCHMIAHGL